MEHEQRGCFGIASRMLNHLSERLRPSSISRRGYYRHRLRCLLCYLLSIPIFTYQIYKLLRMIYA